MKQICVYKKPFGYIGKWDWEKEKRHLKLIKDGWVVSSIEDSKDWDTKKAVALGCLFLPLAFLGKVDSIKVTYDKND